MQKWRQLLMVKISYSCVTSLCRILIFKIFGFIFAINKIPNIKKQPFYFQVVAKTSKIFTFMINSYPFSP